MRRIGLAYVRALLRKARHHQPPKPRPQDPPPDPNLPGEWGDQPREYTKPPKEEK